MLGVEKPYKKHEYIPYTSCLKILEVREYHEVDISNLKFFYRVPGSAGRVCPLPQNCCILPWCGPESKPATLLYSQFQPCTHKEAAHRKSQERIAVCSSSDPSPFHDPAKAEPSRRNIWALPPTGHNHHWLKVVSEIVLINLHLKAFPNSVQSYIHLTLLSNTFLFFIVFIAFVTNPTKCFNMRVSSNNLRISEEFYFYFFAKPKQTLGGICKT